jgi:hypothetical protein
MSEERTGKCAQRTYGIMLIRYAHRQQTICWWSVICWWWYAICLWLSVLSSLMTYHWVRKYSNTTVPPMEKELHTLPEHLSSFLVFGEVRVVQSLVFCVVFCRPLFDLFLLTFVLSVLFLLTIVLSVRLLLTIVLSVLFLLLDKIKSYRTLIVWIMISAYTVHTIYILY